MKDAAMLLALLGFIYGVAAPAVAVSLEKRGTVVFEQDKCKEGEMWDKATKKCVKKP
ncbi:MAG: hypothetical protein ACR2PO_00425 [Methyloligellaceae bacterium]